jgi:hypothetical protein
MMVVGEGAKGRGPLPPPPSNIINTIGEHE